MGQDLASENQMDSYFVRTQLDEILANEITSLIDIDADLAIDSYNMATLSCIIIAVDREREIKQFGDFPPERFTLESFIDELVDIGLERDDSLVRAAHSVIDRGFIRVTSTKKIKAEVPAYTMVGFLDNMFPGMQGLNLIAFVLQMHDEVMTGRKNLEEAKTVFAQTLKSRGVSVSRQKAEKKASELAAGKVDRRYARTTAKKLKEENVKRISKLRLKRSGTKPSMYSGDGDISELAKVKDVFDRDADIEEAASVAKAREIALKEAEAIKARAVELERREKELKEAEARLKEIEEREKALQAAKEEEKRQMELKARELEMAARESELKVLEARLKALEEEQVEVSIPEIPEEEEDDDGQLEDDIESRIAAFEADLAMPCPICGEGRVLQEKTAKNREYYSCNSKSCRFVSWEKPYHFSCPLCKNVYLTEYQTPEGGIGLKCPRAACSYTQKTLQDPAIAAQAEAIAPKKKKKLVRRVKKKR